MPTVSLLIYSPPTSIALRQYTCCYAAANVAMFNFCLRFNCSV